MTEILFYHLEQRPLEKVLPVLLEKSLERGWRAVVEVGRADRLAGLDKALWTYSEESFLPHAIMGEAENALQSVVLTDADANPNGAKIRFFVDRAVPKQTEDYDRLVFMFDGHDPDAVTDARAAWKALSPDNEVTYWQQEPSGRWVKKA